MRFFRKKELLVRRKAHNYNDPFLQPLAVAIVSAILVALILTMGILEFKRSEKNLLAFMEDQAMSTIGVLQRLTEENLKSIVSPEKKSANVKNVSQDEASYSKQWVVEAITKMALMLDDQWKKGKTNNDYLQKFATDNNFLYVGLLNAQGNAVHQSSPLQTKMLDPKDLVKNGRKLTTIELLEKLREKQKIGFIGLRRKDNSGTVVINLDKPGLIYWSLKVAGEKGMNKIGEGHGIIYMQIINKQNKLLSSVGQPPPNSSNKNLKFNEILDGKVKIASRQINYGENKILDLVAPLLLDKKIVGIVKIGLDRRSMDKSLAENKQNIFIFSFFIVLIALLSMWLLYHDQNRHLAGIVEMERQLEKAERLSSLGQLAAGVAHEIRNPLNAISIAAQRLNRDFIPEDQKKAEDFKNLSGVIKDEIKRLNGIIEEFLTFSKSRRLDFSKFSITEMLQKIVSLIREEASTRGITIETTWRYTPGLISMDVNKLQQAFINLIKNAMESISEAKGKIIIAVEKEDKNHIVVKISDTGCGMTSEEIEKIFSPEYTTKEKGVGLGIPLAFEIIRGHDGDIRVISRKGRGTTFEVVLPVERFSET
ncbi:MAG: GHKL domain-containing protein [Deltaproteobacteria bacterium]|nr:GHKL domain-containing protein [Deltaproteobacteria bacterium]